MMQPDELSMNRRAVAALYAEERFGIEYTLTFVEASEKTFETVAAAMFREGRRSGKRRPRIAAHRRELVRAGLNANGVPWWVQKLVFLGRFAAYLLPAPFNVIVPAVLWMVERMIQAEEESTE